MTKGKKCVIIYLILFLDVSLLDNKYYENVISEMQPFFDENGFKLQADGTFSNDTKSVKVSYDEEKQMYMLFVADFDEEKKLGEYAKLNAWLFDDTQNARDAESVGIDFVNSLRKELGVKVTRKTNTNGIDLPTASKGDSMDIAGFAKKMLDFFPELKDAYKEHISVFGNFLYLNFFGEHLVPKVKELFETNNKKQVKKFYSLLMDAYVKGTTDTINVTIAILAAAAFENETVDTAIKAMLEENTHFTMSYNSFKPVFAKNKKLKAALVK